MATAVHTQTTRGGANRGRRTNTRGRGGPRGGGPRTQASDGNNTSAVDEIAPAMTSLSVSGTTATPADGTAAQGAEDVCFICAEPVKYWSVSECNHRTCHVCALRLRALYKKTDCTFCKEPQPTVIFTTSIDALFASYAPEQIQFKDSRLQIFFETQEMMEETMILLRFNCPDPACDYIATSGWGDLKLHVRGMHGKQMCDVCIRNKKVFAHEHALYTPGQLAVHLPSLSQRGGRGRGGAPTSESQIEGGIHPICEFCRECFFSTDELYPHMRERHEECFVCKRQDVRDQYFQNYEALERHFDTAHCPCRTAECVAQKFVVFGSQLDLQGHMVDVHGAAMNARDKREAMRVQADFAYDEPGGGGGGGGGGRGRGRGRGGGGGGGGEGRGRDREQPPIPGAGPPLRGAPSGGRRREGFGGHLTGGNTSGGPAAPTGPTPPRAPSPLAPAADVDPVVAERHAAFVARLQTLAPNPPHAVAALKAAIRSYRASESAARDLIQTTWTVLDRELENTATVINMLVDLLDDDEKKQDLLSAWNGFKVEQRRQFPDLVPSAVGGGFANITSGRVLNAKSSTATRSHPSRQVWDRVAQAAASSSSSSGSGGRFVPGAMPPPSQSQQRLPDRFPPLHPSAPAPVQPKPAAAGQHKTAWSASAGRSTASASSAAPAPLVPFSVSGPGASSSAARRGASAPKPALTNSAFPQLPSAGGGPRERPKVGGNQSLRNIVGDSGAPKENVWGSGGGAGGSGGGNGDGGREVPLEGDQAPVGAKGKKGKGKGKQTLFTLGTIPS